MIPVVILVHGGAGTITRSLMTPEKEKAYTKKLEDSLARGYALLQNGGTSLDAVEIAVKVLEDSELFNAGKGSVFTADGSHELEASIMCGDSLRAGAVGGVKGIKNPVTLSRKVMEHTDYVFLVGEGAQKFAHKSGTEVVDETYFYSSFRHEQWQKVKHSGRAALDHSDMNKFGTVGAVALDVRGNLAAATSTGGLTNKRFGRIGDSAMIGAGNYANNNTCAISCTGYGEFFIRGVVAYDISCLMEYRGLTLADAAREAIHTKQKALGGEGGVIGLDRHGNFVMDFNSSGMYRGVKSQVNDQSEVKIYRD